MNFFDDDFGLGSTPLYSKKPAYTSVQKGNADQASRKSGKREDFDDLLDDILSKEEKRSSKKREKEAVQPYSSTHLDPPSHMDFRKTEKWSTPNIEIDQFLQSPKFPLGKHTSIMDDRISEDARSYRSGFTGRQNNVEFDNLITLRGETKEEAPVVERSARNIMKPPLRKKESKQFLAKEQKELSFWDEEQPQTSFPRRAPEQTNLDLVSVKEIRSKSRDEIESERTKEKVIEKEKIIREEAAELKKQFSAEVKEIKESYERQLNTAQERLNTMTEQLRQSKTQLVKQYEEKLAEERTRWQKLMSENAERLKEVHEWQLRKKCEAYEMEIEKLRSISKFEDSIIKNQQAFHSAQDSIEVKSKQRDLQSEKQRLEEFKFHLEQRQKNLEFEEAQFGQYKKKEEEKLQFDRRALYEKENELKRFELESKRSLALQKQQIASELAEGELENFRKREALNLEREELRSLREMIEKEKSAFEGFNANVLSDYKAKMREVEAQKEHLNDMEIQVHKNIHLLELAEGQMRATGTKLNPRPSTAASNVENHRNRSNTELSSKLQQTKGRFREMENFARQINVETHEERERMKEKVNLSGYITRVNRALSKY